MKDELLDLRRQLAEAKADAENWFRQYKIFKHGIDPDQDRANEVMAAALERIKNGSADKGAVWAEQQARSALLEVQKIFKN